MKRLLLALLLALGPLRPVFAATAATARTAGASSGDNWVRRGQTLFEVVVKKIILLALLASPLIPVFAHASTINPNSLNIPTDPALSFVALGGGVAAVDSFFWDWADKSPVEPAWMKNYAWRLGIEVALGWTVGYIGQAGFGSDRNAARDLDYANFAAFGAAGVWAVSYGVKF